ncbi:MAG: M20/M25/M40 family metallo-hydrolase [Candidatus Sumerlaeia bacterium]|nr:M20/M25/M40 family metallo-hydrolase [Candidatus Sumerlaeia bacterium]
MTHPFHPLRAVLLLLLVVSGPFAAGAQSTRPLIEHVRELAAEGYAGRLAGTPGERRAAAYIVAELERLGVQPLPGAEGFLHEFPLPPEWERPLPTGLNVVGWLPATVAADGPASPTAVLLGAHYDHVGDGLAIAGIRRPGRRGPHHPGADDNASGVAVVLGAAVRLARAPERPRPVVLAFFSAEESGLVGSAHLARTWGGVPLGRVVVADMVGRLGSGPLQVEATEGVRPVVAAEAGRLDVALSWLPVGALSTDVRSFDGRVGETVALTTGPHADKDTPGDTVDKIDAGGLERLAALAAGLAR